MTIIVFYFYNQFYLKLFFILKLMASKHENVLHQKIKTFSFINVLGQGAFAKVYEAIDQRDHSQIAIKAISKKLMFQTPKLQQLVKTEIKVLRTCSNQNVIRYIDSFTSAKSVFIATQFCNGGDLQQYLEQRKRLTQDQATEFLKQILNGFKGLHEAGAMHRDFKLANILLHDGICKIADLGFAKQLQKSSTTQTILGTSLTMAPQVLDERPYGIQADLWSIGVVYYQMIYGRYPYVGLNDFDILKKIKNNRPDYSAVMISKQCREFIDKCLTVNPKSRIKWSEVYTHPLLNKNDGRFIYHALKSKIFVKDNYFQNNNKSPQINKNGNFKKNNLVDLNWDDGEQIRKSINLDYLVEEKKIRERISKNCLKYHGFYINKRNSIMFITKFICPNVNRLITIKANHGIALFIMSKKAYIDCKQFKNQLIETKNIFSLKQDWNEFVNSKQYNILIEQINQDIEMIKAMNISYSFDIEIRSKYIEAEMDIDVIKSKNWNNLVNDTINQYWFLLAEEINSKIDKRTIITVLEALDFYRQNKIADVESFAKKMEVLDVEQTSQKIKKKMQSIYQ